MPRRWLTERLVVPGLQGMIGPGGHSWPVRRDRRDTIGTPRSVSPGPYPTLSPGPEDPRSQHLSDAYASAADFPLLLVGD